MSTSLAMPVDRWWERAAARIGLELPTGLTEVPTWVFAEGETRRLCLGPRARSVTVGAGWTGRVLLDALKGRGPLSPAALVGVLDHALEGPLWLDVGPDRASLEGAVFTFRGGVPGWVERVERGAAGALGAVDASGLAAAIAQALPEARIAGTILDLAPEPRLSLVLQWVEGVAPTPLAERWGAVGALAGLSLEGVALGGRWLGRFLDAGVRVFDLIVPATGAASVTLRGWNLPEAEAVAFVEEAGADADAVRRVRALREASGRDDVARGALSLAGDRAERRLVFDLGLVF